MTTLTTSPVVDLLPRLFADAATSNAKLHEMFGALSHDQRLARMRDPDADYRQLYHRASEHYMAVAPHTARLLYMLARMTGARAIVEFGTSFGVSTIHLAAALRDNGGGALIGSELEPSKIATARANLSAAGLDDLVDVREGDALETLARDLPASIDVVLLDGHKPLYARVLELLAPRLHPGSCLVADNADACPDYLARVRSGDGTYLSVPFGEDVELTIKL
jgi:predicted O-methyltransferase YrrM